MSDIVDFKKAKEERIAPERIWKIPQVYRLTGYKIDLARTEGASFPFASACRAPVSYTLYNKKTEKVAKPVWTPVDSLDPAVDQGWVMIRHHENMERLYGYVMCQNDAFRSAKAPTGAMFGTSRGIYTLTHYPVIPAQLPQPLLIYARTCPGIPVDELINSDENLDQYLIYHSNGTLTSDPEILIDGPI